MAGVKYHVDIDFKVNGDAAAAAGDKLGKKAQDASKAWKDAGRTMLDGFTGAVEKVGAMAMSVGQGALAGGVAAITYGVTGLNKELETTTISLAAVLNANDMAGGRGIAGGMEEAATWVAQMKKDARDLPGEFEELLQIVQTGAGSAFKIGLDVQGFEKLASSAMAAGKALAVPLDQAGRELAQLMDGRAGAHNVFGVRLGIDAHTLYKDLDGAQKKFNELSGAGRKAILEEKIGGFAPAIKVFGQGYDAQSSTLVDNAKQLLQMGTKELFGRVVKDLTDINTWFDENRNDLEAWAKSVAHDLVDLHDRVRGVAEEWGPVLKEFGQNAYKRFAELWKEAEPYVSRIASHIKEFLKDDKALDKIATVLKLYIAAKVGGAALSVGSAVAPLAGAAGNAIGGGISSATGALGAQGAAALPAATAAIAGVGLAIYQWGELQKDRERYAQEDWGNFQDYARNLSEASKDLTNEFGNINLAGQMYQEELARITANSGEAAAAVYSFAVAMQNAEADLKKIGKDKDKEEHQNAMDWARSLGNDLAQAALAGEKIDLEKKRKKTTEGKGTMTVNGNVYFTISSNQAPGQIAREVQRTLIEKKRFRTSSPHTRNFGTAGTGG